MERRYMENLCTLIRIPVLFFDVILQETGRSMNFMLYIAVAVYNAHFMHYRAAKQ
jgi:hypothetical protein